MYRPLTYSEIEKFLNCKVKKRRGDKPSHELFAAGEFEVVLRDLRTQALVPVTYFALLNSYRSSKGETFGIHSTSLEYDCPGYIPTNILSIDMTPVPVVELEFVEKLIALKEELVLKTREELFTLPEKDCIGYLDFMKLYLTKMRK